jgi:hypothetical protein
MNGRALLASLTLVAFGCQCDAEPRARFPERRQVPMTTPTPIEQLSNDDLRWDGTALGLQPRIGNPRTAQLVNNPAVPDSALRLLLRDPQRFAIAHVLLTMRSGKLGSFDANQWNGLRVTLDASGAARYDAADMTPLAERWHQE